MDVALDANVILNDPRMQGNAFHSLLDYLKKTSSRLVLSRIVLDEVSARYPERLRSAIHKATGPVGSLGSLLFDAKVKLPEIDINRETKKLKQKLLRPSHHVRSSLILNNFADINTEEVAKRGIERIPPASKAGEELRDVMHWLMLLANARKSRREIAFITCDEHFRHETGLHPRLTQDVKDNEISLCFYISIDEFIKAHAPTPRDLTESEAFGYYGKPHVMDRFEIAARKFFPRRWPTASSIDILQRDVRLVRGALYDVGPHSQFGELEFSGEFTVRVTTDMSIINYGVDNYYFDPHRQVNFISGYSYSDADLSTPQIIALDESKQDRYAINSGITSPSNFVSTFVPNTPFSSVPIVSEYRVTGGIVISLRVISGKVVNIETERCELGKIEKTS